MTASQMSTMLIVLGLLGTPAAASSVAVDPGVPGDGVVDLYLDASVGTLLIDTDATILSGFVIRSEAGIFTGGPANLQGWFQEDTNNSISDNMGFVITDQHLLGAVIGPEWNIIGLSARGSGLRSSRPPVDPYHDLTFTYTLAGTPGAYYGNLIVVPEPATVILFTVGGLLVARRRR